MSNRLFYSLFGLFILAVIAITVYAVMRLEDRTDACHNRQGITVKTVSGWKCIDAKII